MKLTRPLGIATALAIGAVAFVPATSAWAGAGPAPKTPLVSTSVQVLCVPGAKSAQPAVYVGASVNGPSKSAHHVVVNNGAKTLVNTYLSERTYDSGLIFLDTKPLTHYDLRVTVDGKPGVNWEGKTVNTKGRLDCRPAAATLSLYAGSSQYPTCYYQSPGVVLAGVAVNVDNSNGAKTAVVTIKVDGHLLMTARVPAGHNWGKFLVLADGHHSVTVASKGSKSASWAGNTANAACNPAEG